MLPFFKKVVVFESGSIVLPQHDREEQKQQNKERNRKVKEKSRKFVQQMLQMCGVKKIDSVERHMINHRHVMLMIEFLPEETEEVLSKLFRSADVNRQPIYLSAESDEFTVASFGEITPSACTLIRRIIGSQGREIEITKDGLIVSPHSALVKARNRKQKELQTA